MDGWVNENVVYSYKGILLTLEEEGHLDTRCNLEDIMLSETSQSSVRQASHPHLYGIPRIVKFRRHWLPGAGAGVAENGELVFNE